MHRPIRTHDIAAAVDGLGGCRFTLQVPGHGQAVLLAPRSDAVEIGRGEAFRPMVVEEPAGTLVGAVGPVQHQGGNQREERFPGGGAETLVEVVAPGQVHILGQGAVAAAFGPALHDWLIGEDRRHRPAQACAQGVRIAGVGHGEETVNRLRIQHIQIGGVIQPRAGGLHLTIRPETGPAGCRGVADHRALVMDDATLETDFVGGHQLALAHRDRGVVDDRHRSFFARRALLSG